MRSYEDFQIGAHKLILFFSQQDGQKSFELNYPVPHTHKHSNKQWWWLHTHYKQWC